MSTDETAENLDKILTEYTWLMEHLTKAQVRRALHASHSGTHFEIVMTVDYKDIPKDLKGVLGLP